MRIKDYVISLSDTIDVIDLEGSKDSLSCNGGGGGKSSKPPTPTPPPPPPAPVETATFEANEEAPDARNLKAKREGKKRLQIPTSSATTGTGLGV